MQEEAAAGTRPDGKCIWGGELLRGGGRELELIRESKRGKRKKKTREAASSRMSISLEQLVLQSASAAQLRVSPGNRVATETEPFWRKRC